MTNPLANALNTSGAWSFGYLGQRVNVGIVSDSFNWDGASTMERVDIIWDQRGTDEGRAMAELIRFVAPECDITFSAARNELMAAASIDQLVLDGCQIICCDMAFWGSTNYYISAAIDRATAAGAIFVSSAGNKGASKGDKHGSAYTANPNSNPIGAVDVLTPGMIAPYSSISENLRFVAPAGIETSLPARQLATFHGTSAAVASAAGLLALVEQVAPGIAMTDAIQVVRASCAAVSAPFGELQTGAGLANATLAVGIAMLSEHFDPSAVPVFAP
jgi:hypothetical protein